MGPDTNVYGEIVISDQPTAPLPAHDGPQDYRGRELSRPIRRTQQTHHAGGVRRAVGQTRPA